jgi:hypothetical protein
MIEYVRRLEYNFLKRTRRPYIGKYVKTEIQSCQLHDSNLVNVELSRRLRMLDLTRRDPFNGLMPAIDEIKGNKKTESWSINTARFISSSVKKEGTWKNFLLDNYGDNEGIKSVKSARFWSVMILMGTYWYKRMKYLLEFAEIMKDSYEDNQIGANLKDLRRNKELFESDCLLEYVDYHGFHKGWNYGASNFNSGKQAKKAHRTVKFHKRCLTDRSAREAFWNYYAKEAVLERRMHEWACDYYTANGAHPKGKRKLLRQRRLIKQSLTRSDYSIPAGCTPRVQAMHGAIVDKLTEMLESIVATGAAPLAVQISDAPSTNMPVECASICIFLHFLCQTLLMYVEGMSPLNNLSFIDLHATHAGTYFSLRGKCTTGARSRGKASRRHNGACANQRRGEAGWDIPARIHPHFTARSNQYCGAS